MMINTDNINNEMSELAKKIGQMLQDEFGKEWYAEHTYPKEVQCLFCDEDRFTVVYDDADESWLIVTGKPDSEIDIRIIVAIYNIIENM